MQIVPSEAWDFSSAFNTIDHDRLLVRMHDLGFPSDCTEVNKDLYGSVKAQLVLPAGTMFGICTSLW